jgi:antitoxin component of MazEF toxin-antitoxin module
MESKTSIEHRPIRVRKEGHALVVSIPGAVCAELCLKNGDFVWIGARDGEFVGRKIDLRRVRKGVEVVGEKQKI